MNTHQKSKQIPGPGSSVRHVEGSSTSKPCKSTKKSARRSSPPREKHSTVKRQEKLLTRAAKAWKKIHTVWEVASQATKRVRKSSLQKAQQLRRLSRRGPFQSGNSRVCSSGKLLARFSLQVGPVAPAILILVKKQASQWTIEYLVISAAENSIKQRPIDTSLCVNRSLKQTK